MELYPWLSESVVGGSLGAEEGQANPRLVSPEFARAASKAGAQLMENTQVISRFQICLQDFETLISNLNADFKSRCLSYDAYDFEIKGWDEKHRLGLVQVKQDFDDILAASMMNLKDEIDSRVQSLMAQVKQQEDSIADVIETVGQQNAAQENVIKEMRVAMAAIRSS